MTTMEQPMLFQPSEPVSGHQGEQQASESEGQTEQPVGMVSFDGQIYVYDGCVIEREQFYVPRRIAFTADEAGILPSCELGRVLSMVNAVGRDQLRQTEIRTYGKRSYRNEVWHSIVRPKRIVTQALDFAFRHAVAWGFYCLPYVEELFRQEPGQAETWVHALCEAYLCRHREEDAIAAPATTSGHSLVGSPGMPAVTLPIANTTTPQKRR